MYEQMDCSIIILKQMTGNAFWVLGREIFKGFVKHMGFSLPPQICQWSHCDEAAPFDTLELHMD